MNSLYTKNHKDKILKLCLFSLNPEYSHMLPGKIQCWAAVLASESSAFPLDAVPEI